MPRFQALQAEESAQIHDGGLIDVTLPLVTGWWTGSARASTCSTSAAGTATRPT